jgi:hypothetical protein
MKYRNMRGVDTTAFARYYADKYYSTKPTLIEHNGIIYEVASLEEKGTEIILKTGRTIEIDKVSEEYAAPTPLKLKTQWSKTSREKEK